MIHPFLSVVALCNSAFLIAIFVVRKNPASPLLRKIGKTYLVLFIPAGIAGIVIVLVEHADPSYLISLAAFLAYLGLEALFDYVLKVDFRSNWKLVVPYLVLYYVYNYGFFVMPWKQDLVLGIILLSLFIAQLVTNAITHPRSKKKPGTA
ncbi:MAG: hypothetical protein JW839_12435 [Candidatus Lokiarchaeota archaeon]|nr:hypothetical protein [Candidatus Lokiarchaeota archaeon]